MPSFPRTLSAAAVGVAAVATIAPEVRATMGQQLAAEVSAYVAPAAPAGTPPEAYLMAVLTERLRRATAARPGTVRPSPGRRETALPTAPDFGAVWAPPPPSAATSPAGGGSTAAEGPFALPR